MTIQPVIILTAMMTMLFSAGYGLRSQPLSWTPLVSSIGVLGGQPTDIDTEEIAGNIIDFGDDE